MEKDPLTNPMYFRMSIFELNINKGTVLRWDNAFATFILFRRKISFSNPELFFHFARCTKDTLKCISMFFAFSNDIRKGGIFIDF